MREINLSNSKSAELLDKKRRRRIEWNEEKKYEEIDDMRFSYIEGPCDDNSDDRRRWQGGSWNSRENLFYTLLSFELGNPELML